ncbi:MAG: hypothetical protein IT270_02145 [Saprospiraceae bacterium]|nr:hypothetical protein [Saprospiraceae bacterium]
MKTLLFAFCLLAGPNLNAQIVCDTIYGSPETPPIYGHNFDAFYMYFNDSIVPVLQECMKQEDTVISGLVVRFTLDYNGHVLDVEFLRINAGEACKQRVRERFMAMGDWSPGWVRGEPVCSYAVWPIRCLKWE